MSDEVQKEVLTVDGKEFVLEDLPADVQERVAIAKMWEAERDAAAKVLREKDLEVVKIQFALSVLGQEIVELVKKHDAPKDEVVKEVEGELV